MTRALLTAFATPNHMVGQGCPGTTYFRTRTVTLPASPPAMSAKPMNSTRRAFHATPEPEYEYESADSRAFSMLLITSIPSTLHSSGIQSTIVTCTLDVPFAVLENTEASRKVKKPRENCGGWLAAWGGRKGGGWYECAGAVDSCCAEGERGGEVRQGDAEEAGHGGELG